MASPSATMSQLLPNKSLLTSNEVCEILRIKRRTLRLYLAKGTLPPPLQVNSMRFLFKRSDILAYLESLELHQGGGGQFRGTPAWQAQRRRRAQ